jgi:hypothetical protein
MTAAADGAPRPPAGKPAVRSPHSSLTLTPQSPPGSIAGSWSPPTRRPVTELTGLVVDLAARGLVATGLTVSVNDWAGTPGRLHIGDRDVRLRWLAYRAGHTVTVQHQTGQISLAIHVPDAPQTTPPMDG